MQQKKNQYDQQLLILGILAALGISLWFYFTKDEYRPAVSITTVAPKKDFKEPGIASINAALKTIQEKVDWTAPARNGKMVPLNKSVVLIKKGDQLFDLYAEEPQYRPPFKNADLLKYNLPTITSPNFGELDSDHDGFTNEEEYIKGKDLLDDKSFPSILDKLKFQQRNSFDYIIKLASTAAPYQVQRLKPDRGNKFVSVNDEFGFDKNSIRFKALKFEVKKEMSAANLEMDVSELTIKDLTTDKDYVLVKGKDVNLVEYEAQIIFKLKDKEEEIKRKVGEIFQLPGTGKSYKIVDISENSCTIAEILPDGGLGNEAIIQ
jgi:hypothetical protein